MLLQCHMAEDRTHQRILNPTLHGCEPKDGVRSSQAGTDTKLPLRAEKMTEAQPRSQSKLNVCGPLRRRSTSARGEPVAVAAVPHY